MEVTMMADARKFTFIWERCLNCAGTGIINHEHLKKLHIAPIECSNCKGETGRRIKVAAK